MTITQVQALRAARNAGIQVPPAAIKKAYEYLKACTSPNGAVYYSLRSRTERPAITAAAVACLFNAGQYKDPLGKRWLKYCRRTIPLVGGNGASVRFGHIEYTHYYFAQCVYVLGDDGWEDLFGKTPKNQQVTWTGYRQRLFDQLAREQSSNGSWTTRSGFSVGPVYSTALYCTILQLDKGTLPIYQR